MMDERSGVDVALCSDAGQPLISDPGYPTLREVKRRILLDAEHLRGRLVEGEERAFRAALLDEDPNDPAA